MESKKFTNTKQADASRDNRQKPRNTTIGGRPTDQAVYRQTSVRELISNNGVSTQEDMKENFDLAQFRANNSALSKSFQSGQIVDANQNSGFFVGSSLGGTENFSTEGIDVPGSSLIRFVINKTELITSKYNASTGSPLVDGLPATSLQITSPISDEFKQNGQNVEFSRAEGGSSASEFTVSNTLITHRDTEKHSIGSQTRQMIYDSPK
jgi:hypothetical protein